MVIRTVSSNLLKFNPKILPHHELIPCPEKQTLGMLKVNTDGENFIWRLWTYKFEFRCETYTVSDTTNCSKQTGHKQNNTRFSLAVLPGHVLTN